MDEVKKVGIVGNPSSLPLSTLIDLQSRKMAQDQLHKTHVRKDLVALLADEYEDGTKLLELCNKTAKELKKLSSLNKRMIDTCRSSGLLALRVKPNISKGDVKKLTKVLDQLHNHPAFCSFDFENYRTPEFHMLLAMVAVCKIVDRKIVGRPEIQDERQSFAYTVSEFILRLHSMYVDERF